MNIVIVLRGPAGVGKTSIAQILQKRLGVNWVIIDVDRLKYYMQLKPGESNRAERSNIAHNVSRFFAKQAYDRGYNVVLEEMYKKAFNDSLVEYLKDNGMKYLKVFLAAPEDVIADRANNREKHKPEDEIRRHYKEIMPYEDDFVIDTTKYSAEESADLIISQVNNMTN
jgi:predicted kinase